MKRVLTAAVGIPLALAALFFLPSAGFLALVAVLLLIACFELCRLARKLGAQATVWLLPAGLLAVSILLFEPGSLLSTGWDSSQRFGALGVLLTLGAASTALIGSGPATGRVVTAGFLGLGSLYLALPLVSFGRLREADPYLIVLILGVVWLTDSGAYFVGRTWGRTKLAPTISPNKTWEGAVGGLALGLIAAALWSWWRLEGLEVGVVVAGGLVSTVGQVGDLIESAIKRAAGVKDSAALLPGHGGMFDRLDSLIVAAPVFELVWPLCRPL